MFTKLSKLEDHKVRSLSLATELNDLSSIPTETLVRGISGLEAVGLSGVDLTIEQVSAIFSQVSTLENHKLRMLKTANNDLSSIPSDILVSGISYLEKVDLMRTNMTTDQTKP